MFRAIKSFNGGERVEFQHFRTLVDAYGWLQPPLNDQMDERWHIKVFRAVQEAVEAGEQGRVVVGWNELNAQTFLYIQEVSSYGTALPEL
jgi:hypothetical protein